MNKDDGKKLLEICLRMGKQSPGRDAGLMVLGGLIAVIALKTYQYLTSAENASQQEQPHQLESELRSQNNVLTNQIKSLQQQIDTLTALITDKEEEIERLQLENEQQTREGQTSLAELWQEKETLKHQLEILKSNLKQQLKQENSQHTPCEHSPQYRYQIITRNLRSTERNSIKNSNTIIFQESNNHWNIHYFNNQQQKILKGRVSDINKMKLDKIKNIQDLEAISQDQAMKCSYWIEDDISKEILNTIASHFVNNIQPNSRHTTLRRPSIFHLQQTSMNNDDLIDSSDEDSDDESNATVTSDTDNSFC